jgi:cytochrome c biogenesis protein CcdA
MTTPLALAFGAGLVATINPCGFAMLPAYLSYLMGLGDGGRSRAGAVRSAFVIGGLVSLGFVIVFGLAGLVIILGFRAFTTWIPWIALGVGVIVAVLGMAMMIGYEPTITLPTAGRATTRKGYAPVVGFGLSYGIASLSCTLPVFLVAVAGQLTQRSVLAGIAVFGAYVAGKAFMLLALTNMLALGKHSIVTRLRASARYLSRISGSILVLAGAFIVWFWATEIGSGATALGDSVAYRTIERVQSSILDFIADRTLLTGIGFGAVIIAAAAYAFR